MGHRLAALSLVLLAVAAVSVTGEANLNSTNTPSTDAVIACGRSDTFSVTSVPVTVVVA